MLNVIDRALRRSQKAVTDLHPLIEQKLAIPVRYYASSWIQVAKIIGSIRHDAPIDPMQIYYVDPRQIERTITWTQISADRKADEHPRFQPPKYRLAGRVFEGDWDKVDAYVTESTIYQSFVSHFEDGVPWKETAFYEETFDAIEDGATPWDCSSQSDLDKRCKRLDKLYERIISEGYKTQDELHEAGDPTTSPYRPYRVLWGEIAINVGRNGELIFHDGRNRLAIARILGLEEVPVVILVRHEKWQQTRDRIARGELNKSNICQDLRNHPDLVGLF